MNVGMSTNSLRSDDTSPNPLNLHGEASFQKSRTQENSSRKRVTTSSMSFLGCAKGTCSGVVSTRKATGRCTVSVPFP